MLKSSNRFMQIALEQANIAFENDEVPVGCVIVEDGKIIAKNYNQNRKKFDPCAHAEILTIREACALKKTLHLINCDIFITLEPCAMCLMAISYSKIKRIYYGANDEKFGSVESNPIFKNTNISHFKSEVYSGIYEFESATLLKDFFIKKR